MGRDLKRYKLNVTGTRWIKYGGWLAAARDPQNFRGKRILVQEITGGKEKRIIAAFYDQELYHSRDVIPIKCTDEQYHHFYLLGIINSNLVSWLHRKLNPKSQKGLFPKILVSDLRKLPIPKINKMNTELVKKLIKTVELMIAILYKTDSIKTPNDRITMERQIDATDKQIDKLVYELYGLTEEEIKIVEGEAG